MSQTIETGFKLLLWYLAATFIATQLWLVLEPPQAHVPGGLFMVLSPLGPFVWIKAILEGRASAANVIALLIVAAALAVGTWHSLRKRAG
ncbi:hypothetical protein [Massilia antarctica]|uniref:hypothetical protein n=1 Tax=Massilia antarctica TaxID=2765360 RepID=UPI0006BB76B2|nr:hypothetical protein [Massilia sp. H27-R4]MCY0911776.1 hypothetical protein [Massilia sp. H27-R4]CUI06770.1 hypothetical protein BN2497_8317 [Janthinobacterium sp. CG23_2]CUU30556.1 hypothetical protein BN3177_8317 [Janthinobacterium sp. CG23_2]